MVCALYVFSGLPIPKINDFWKKGCYEFDECFLKHYYLQPNSSFWSIILSMDFPKLHFFLMILAHSVCCCCCLWKRCSFLVQNSYKSGNSGGWQQGALFSPAVAAAPPAGNHVMAALDLAFGGDRHRSQCTVNNFYTEKRCKEYLMAF